MGHTELNFWLTRFALEMRQQNGDDPNTVAVVSCVTCVASIDFFSDTVALVSAHPSAILELLAYNLTIIKASQQYDGLLQQEVI